MDHGDSGFVPELHRQRTRGSSKKLTGYVEWQCSQLRISKTPGQSPLTEEQRAALREAGFPVTDYEFVPVSEDAQTIFELWQLLRDQTVSGGLGVPISLNIATILQVFDLYSISFEKRQFYLEMIIYIAKQIFSAANESIEDKK